MTAGELLLGILLAILGIAVLVAGYYLGILFAVIAGALTILGLAFLAIFFLGYAIWDFFHYRKQRKRDQ